MAAPPGLTPAPPFQAPPSPPSGANGSNGAEEAPVSDLRQEISQKIGNQVQQMLQQAKKESEQKVTAELRLLHNVMQEMDARLDNIVKQMDELQAAPKSEALEQSAVVQALAKVEQQWGKELGKLKGELHQTIFAHNHNADLMKHQKDTLDQIRNEIDVRSNPEKLKAAKAQLAKLESLKQGTMKQKKLEPLMQRMVALEQKVAAAWRWQSAGMMGGPAAPGLEAAKFPSMPPAGMPVATGYPNPAMVARASMMAAMAKQQSAALAAQAEAAEQAAAYFAKGSGMGSATYTGVAEAEEEDEDTLESVLAKALAATGSAA